MHYTGTLERVPLGTLNQDINTWSHSKIGIPFHSKENS